MGASIIHTKPNGADAVGLKNFNGTFMKMLEKYLYIRTCLVNKASKYVPV